MFETYLVNQNVIGSTVITALDYSELMMYSTYEGKVFMKSRDHFRTIDEKWFMPADSVTANANVIRLKDGRMMILIKLVSPIIRIAELGGADFVALFSTDDGHTFGNPVRLNRDNGCYYIMNQRIMRTHSGRIIVPVGWVPNELLEKEHETVGYSGCFYSDDEGQSWKESKWVEGKTVDQLCEPIVVQGSDKRLFMYMRTGKGYLYYSVSDDDGVVWSTEERSELRSPCAPFCIQYDKYENRFLAVWCNSFPGPVIQCPRSPICLAQSYDGMHWKMICELDNNPDRSYGYPMIKAYKEEILITYYENPTRKFNFRIHRLKCKIFDRKELLSK